MADLFLSYVNPNNPGESFCDLTDIDSCTDATSRLICTTLDINCGNNLYCGEMVVNNGLILCDCNDSWNCNLCGNDQPFWLPFQPGDKYTYQFQQPQTILPDAYNGWSTGGATGQGSARFQIITCCNQTPIDLTEEQFGQIVTNQLIGEYQITTVGGTTQIVPIQQIQFDLGAIGALLIELGFEPCFYFDFGFNLHDRETVFCSEPWKLEPCIASKKQSVLVESQYQKLDCFGYYYGTNIVSVFYGQPFPYSNEIRVPAAFEQVNFNLNKTIIETSRKTTGSEICENWEMNTHPIPQRFAKLLAVILAGANVSIDGFEYQITGELPKDNEVGTRWWISANFERCECSTTLSCI